MKVYGKNSRPTGYFTNENDLIEVQLSDYESDVEPILDSKHAGNVSVLNGSRDNDCPATGGSSLETSLSNSSNLQAFDFLDEVHRPKKRRRIHHQEHMEDRLERENSNVSSNPLNGTIDDLNKFVGSLKGSDGILLEDTFKKELERSVEDDCCKSNSGKLTYDRSRTILVSKDDDEGLEVEDDDSKQVTKGNGKNKDASDGQTYHINELRNMGDVLHYQDDLELLLEGTPSLMSQSQFVSHLLNIALAMNGDQEFCRYVNKRQSKDMWKRVFYKMDFHDHTMLLMQGFLVTKFHLLPNELPKFFDEFVEALYEVDRLPLKGISGNRIVHLNYDDFLHGTENRTCQEYALELCFQYPEILFPHSSLVTRITQTLQAKHLPRGIFLVTELLASNEETVENTNLFSALSDKLLDLLPSNSQNDHLIKSLILLSNERTFERNNKVFHICMEFFLNQLQDLSGATDILILHLGLCLNAITSETGETVHLENSLWLRALTVLRKLESNDNNNPFLLNMFYLNFAYMTMLLNKRLSTNIKMELISRLKSFSQESSHYNGSICDKINYVTEKL